MFKRLIVRFIPTFLSIIQLWSIIKFVDSLLLSHRNAKILTSIDHLKDLSFFNETMVAIGQTDAIPSTHPVIEIIVDRWRNNSKPSSRVSCDTCQVALSIEGGGMRGCVAAGATAAINFLGLQDSFDVVYGSSAGAMVGAYFVARQYSGVQIYYDILPTVGTTFIDKKRLLSALGVPSWIVDIIHRRPSFRFLKKLYKKSKLLKLSSLSLAPSVVQEIENLHPSQNRHREKVIKATSRRTDVFDLEFLLQRVMNGMNRLDWKTFLKNEEKQPLKIITSSTSTLESLVLSRDNGNYNCIDSLLLCIRASMLVPGVTGPQIMAMKNRRSIPYPKDPSNDDARDIKLDAVRDRELIRDMTDELESIEDTAIKAASGYQKLNDGTILNSKFASDSAALTTAPPPSAWKQLSFGFRRRPPVSKFQRSMISEGDSESYLDKSMEIALNSNGDDASDNLIDALLCEPLPYRSALKEGATHVLMLRTRPDPSPVKLTGKAGIFEKFIARRYFRSHNESLAEDFMLKMKHHRIYAEDLLLLNHASQGPSDGVNIDGCQAHLLALAPRNYSKEVNQLETDRAIILQGLRDGARRVFEVFIPSMKLQVYSIDELVTMIFPDDILERKGTGELYEELKFRSLGNII